MSNSIERSTHNYHETFSAGEYMPELLLNGIVAEYQRFSGELVADFAGKQQAQEPYCSEAGFTVSTRKNDLPGERELVEAEFSGLDSIRSPYRTMKMTMINYKQSPYRKDVRIVCSEGANVDGAVLDIVTGTDPEEHPSPLFQIKRHDSGQLKNRYFGGKFKKLNDLSDIDQKALTDIGRTMTLIKKSELMQEFQSYPKDPEGEREQWREVRQQLDRERLERIAYWAGSERWHPSEAKKAKERRTVFRRLFERITRSSER